MDYGNPEASIKDERKLRTIKTALNRLYDIRSVLLTNILFKVL